MEENNKRLDKGLILKIFVPVLILAVVVGIYIYKNTDEDTISATIQEDEKEVEKEEEATQEELTLEITEVDLDKIKSYKVPFVIDFGSDVCIPCKEMAPVLETLHEEFKGKAIVHFVDVWKNQNAALDFPVSVIPTQVFYNADGTPFVPSEELSQEIDDF